MYKAVETNITKLVSGELTPRSSVLSARKPPRKSATTNALPSARLNNRSQNQTKMKAARWRRNGFIVAFLSPAVLLYAFFVLIPFLQTFQLSFTSFSGVSSKRKFVGWENYQYLFKDEVLWTSFKNVAILLGVGPIIFILVFAARPRNIGRVTRRESHPSDLPLPPDHLDCRRRGALRFIYHPTGGILKGLGIDGPYDGWLGTSSTAFWCVCVAFIWVSLGLYTALLSRDSIHASRSFRSL
ncbi:MAG: sugar ABC transporter permease [Fimbriimonadaceae bacterium]